MSRKISPWYNDYTAGWLSRELEKRASKDEHRAVGDLDFADWGTSSPEIEIATKIIAKYFTELELLVMQRGYSDE